MRKYIDKLKSQTRWNDIPSLPDGYRLLCSNPVCSLSCANLRNGKLSVTSLHGDERHSYIFTKRDMTFAVIEFLNSLDERELTTVLNIFNKISPDYALNLEKL